MSSTKIAEHRFTLGLAAETHGQGISVNMVSPVSAIATPQLVASGWLPDWVFEPVETMVEAVLACVTGDPDVLTGRNAYSLELLHELGRPVSDFTGTTLVDGWQPTDLPPTRSSAPIANGLPADPFGYTFRVRFGVQQHPPVEQTWAQAHVFSCSAGVP